MDFDFDKLQAFLSVKVSAGYTANLPVHFTVRKGRDVIHVGGTRIESLGSGSLVGKKVSYPPIRTLKAGKAELRTYVTVPRASRVRTSTRDHDVYKYLDVTSPDVVEKELMYAHVGAFVLWTSYENYFHKGRVSVPAHFDTRYPSSSSSEGEDIGAEDTALMTYDDFKKATRCPATGRPPKNETLFPFSAVCSRTCR